MSSRLVYLDVFNPDAQSKKNEKHSDKILSMKFVLLTRVSFAMKTDQAWPAFSDGSLRNLVSRAFSLAFILVHAMVTGGAVEILLVVSCNGKRDKLPRLAVDHLARCRLSIVT